MREMCEYVGVCVMCVMLLLSVLVFVMVYIVVNVLLLMVNVMMYWCVYDVWCVNEGVMEDFGGFDVVVEVNVMLNG